MNAPPAPSTGYAELHCLSNFSFQRGASSADELFARAARLGYAALAITDECSIAGSVRALEASRRHGVRLIVGSEVQLADGPKLVLLAADQAGYSDLCRLITTARRRSRKGEYRLTRADAETLGAGVLVLWPVTADADADADTHAAWLAHSFGGRCWLAVELHRGPDDAARLAALDTLGRRHGLPRLASGDVHMHVRRRRALQDVMTAIRLGCTVAAAGHALFANGERHLRCMADLVALYPPALLAETLRVATRCRFDLGTLAYRYPHELVPDGLTASEHLRALTLAGAARRWPGGVPPAVRALLDHELALIAELGNEHFFLTVHDIVAWARAQQPPILCQGRGSSANSAVCYCLGITAVNPAQVELLFERFMSRERREPPDIDVDFEHERREEVIQYVYRKYGRERAALAATVICYRTRSALRDVGGALGLPADRIDVVRQALSARREGQSQAACLREHGLDPDNPLLHRLLVLTGELTGFPRHLSQHVGGFVISDAPLHELVPVENAAMPDRTVIQWDKDDLESLGLLKVDCLALGMLTCLHKCFDLVRRHLGVGLDLATLPLDDAATWDMIAAADTVGVFQIESRAQMAMLPRLQPRNYYDLVVQIAIVRPGPISGDMVHPYLRRRQGLEAVDYPRAAHERDRAGPCAVEQVLGRTLGIPIFQEQVMRLAEITAGFTPGEADQLRRAMAAWKRHGGLEPFRTRLFAGMAERGYEPAFAERIFSQILGFGEYGFPESHSASFAHLAYASAWLKCHFPAAYACALLNSQPMGFYAPAQIVADARRHGVRVLPADVTRSTFDCALERWGGVPALRLGLRQINGVGMGLAERIARARDEHPFRNVADLVQRARLDAGERARLTDAGALHGLAGHRHRARWESAAARPVPALLAGAGIAEPRIALRPANLAENVLADYAAQGLSLAGHPLALLRARLRHRRILSASELLRDANTGRPVRYAGLVTVRQRPYTANGTTFLTLEDETGCVNVVVWRKLAERQHHALTEARVLGVDGVLEAADGVRHLIARRLHDLDAMLPPLMFSTRDFR
ncbi:MAG: error-prone DNA polymerase [Lysobacterales bacterium]